MFAIEHFFGQLADMQADVAHVARHDGRAAQRQLAQRYAVATAADQLHTDMLAAGFTFALPAEVPDAENAVVAVYGPGRKVVGHLRCIRAGGGVLKWYGGFSGATGNAHSRSEAARDVVCWALGLPVRYTQHAVVPLRGLRAIPRTS